ncbi:hypothetical protein [Winogradskyella haliclonae]|uniref:Uncharacterized protein n=1 Tax=Winogradskyella haliclonae TaxID=2048558 RepID=A0ABQ2BWV7_9FLAO|nr:hypothetical protein [Winogradskyella haliclonae]GGI56966.1 hypothetical protein GCM10011444_12750 [Winogradskyella haliclonae]
MKHYLTFIILLLSIKTVVGQDFKVKDLFPKQEIVSIENAVNLYWESKNDNDPQKAIVELEAISKKYPQNWLVPFWSSYIATQVNNTTRDATFLDKAQLYYNDAEKALGSTKNDSIIYSYFKGLQSLIYRLKSFNAKDSKEVQKLQKQSLDELNEGIRLQPENPVLWVLSATGPFNNLRNNLAQQQTSLALLKDAKDKFSEIKERSKADISYMNEHWTDFWINGLSTGLGLIKQD